MRAVIGKAAKLLLAAGMVMIILGGCKREPSASDIMKEAVKNTSKAESFSGNMLMDAGVGIKEGGVSIGFDMNVDMDIDAVKESGACHMKGSVKADLADLAMDMELYNVPGEDGSEFITYAKVADSWKKMKYDVEEETGISELMNLESYIEGGSKLKLQKETEEKDGREVYVITTSTDNRVSQGVGALVDGMFGGLGRNMDFEAAKLDVTFRVYKDDMLPESVSLVLSGKEGEEVVIPDTDGNEIALNSLRLILEFKEFNHLDKIEVPEEALDAESDSMDIMGDLEKDDAAAAEEAMPEPDIRKDEDGNYILTDWNGESEISIPVREGLTVDQYSENTCLSFYKDGEKPYSALYTLETLYEPEDKQFYAESKMSAKEMFETMDEYSDIRYQEEQELEADGRKVTYVSLSYTYNESVYRNEVYAWTMIDDEHMLICEIGEYPEEKEDCAINTDVIKELFEGIM